MGNTLVYYKFAKFFLVFSSLFYVFVFTIQAQAESFNLKGSWKVSTGGTVEIRQAASSITGIITGSSDASRIGKTSFTGTLDGRKFKGEAFAEADRCPNLDEFVPVTGKVSPDGSTITMTARIHRYDPENCVDTGETTASATYTRVEVTPTSTPIPTVTPYAACAIKCLDEVDARYQCLLPASVIDDNGVSVMVLPDGNTRSFSPRDNECVDDRLKIQNSCLSGCPVSVEREPISDPIHEGQRIKVAGTAPDDALNEAGKYINLIKRKPALPSKEEDLKRILGDYEVGKPMSVLHVKGEPEMQVPGSDEWTVLKKDTVIPPGARIFTGMDDDLLVVLPGSYAVKVRAFTDITFNKTGISKALSKGELINHLDLRAGDVEVHVDKETYQGTMQVQMPQAVAGVRGTHFWVSYDETRRLGAVGVYEGEVAVDDLFRGTRTMLTPAKDKTSRVIVMVSTDYGSAQNQKPVKANSQPQTQEPVSTPGQKEQASKAIRNIFISLLSILTAGGGIGLYVLHRKGKLKPLYERYKVFRMIKKIYKKTEDEKI